MSEPLFIAIIVVTSNVGTMLFKFWHDNREYKRSQEADNTANTKLDNISNTANGTLAAAFAEIRELKAQMQVLLDKVKE